MVELTTEKLEALRLRNIKELERTEAIKDINTPAEHLSKDVTLGL
jgi:predicted DNA-binding protein (UPF0251 family)